MDPGTLAQSPYAVLTLIGAPALLTNASSVLALSTINRMLRTRERMHVLYLNAEQGKLSDWEAVHLGEHVSRIEQQALLLLRALRAIYLALGGFAGATLITLLGASLAPFEGAIWFRILAAAGLALGFFGLGGLVYGSVSLFQATRISLVDIREEAAVIRKRHARRQSGETGGVEAL